MVCPNLNFNVDVSKCFGGLWKSSGQPKTEIQKMEKDMEKLKAKRNDIKSKIEKANRELGSLESEEAKQWQRDLVSLEDQVAAIFEDFTRIRFYKNIKIGAWGGSGIKEFDIGRSASRITKVRVISGDVVDSLEVSYVDDGKTVETRQLGGEKGSSHRTVREVKSIADIQAAILQFELSPGEYINSMFGSVCEYCGETCISELQFNTNFGMHYGPFGRASGRQFSVPVKDGRIVGFFGKFSKYLNEIGVYVIPN